MNKTQQSTVNSQQSVADKLTVMAEGPRERGLQGERDSGRDGEDFTLFSRRLKMKKEMREGKGKLTIKN
jgi:hypothetical protein